MVVFTDPHLRGPLALRLAPNGNLLTANGDATANADPAFPSELIEFTKAGAFVRQFDVDASQGGAFGLDTSLDPNALYNFAYIDDVTNNLTLTNITQPMRHGTPGAALCCTGASLASVLAALPDLLHATQPAPRIARPSAATVKVAP